MVLFGHVHNYERTCAVYENECKAMPKKDSSGIDTYDSSKYAAPVHAIIGMAGFTLDQFPNDVNTYIYLSVQSYMSFYIYCFNLFLQFPFVFLTSSLSYYLLICMYRRRVGV